MLGKRIINSNDAGGACTTNTNDYPITNLAYYKMSSAADEKDTYNGTPSNVNFNVQGKFGNAAEFNGSSSRIVTGVTPATGSGQFSVSGWVNVDSLSAIRGVFSTITTPGTDRLGFSVHVLTNGKVRALVYDSAGVGIIESTDLITAGTWHHIAFTYSNGLSKIYVDGDVQASTVNQLITGYYDSINIGTYYASSASLTMLGSIDQVRIFNSALSATEVTDLYDEQYCFDNFFNDDSTVATYKLNNTALDDLGRYNGTASNVTYGAGEFGDAAVFNGSSSYVTTSLDFSNLTDYSISMWVYKDADVTAFFAGTIDSAAKNGIYIRWSDSANSNSNRVGFLERNSSTTANQIHSTDAYTFGQWLNVVVVRDGNTNFLYVNGTAQGSITNAGITHSVDFTMGRAGAYNNILLDGKLDQVRIFDRALDSTEVTALYNE